jgi:hypothetical protein
MTDKFCLGDSLFATRDDDGAVTLTNQNSDTGAVSIRIKDWMIDPFIDWLEDENADGSPYCQYCGAKRQRDCDCGPIAANH